MPNAAATLDSDFAPRAHGRRKPTRAASRKKGGKGAGGLRSATLNRAPRFGAIAISGLIGVGIIVNALMMQHGHHPAPLFAASALATADAAPAKAQLAPPAAAKAEVAESPLHEAAIDEARPVVRAAAAKVIHGDDPIARLISGSTALAPSARKVKALAVTAGAAKTAPVKAAVLKPAPVKVAQDKRRKTED